MTDTFQDARQTHSDNAQVHWENEKEDRLRDEMDQPEYQEQRQKKGGK